jgi:sulfate/thiosulfate transport system substrate-binding protein
MTSRRMNTLALTAVALSPGIVVMADVDSGKYNQILNVSYDPTRELFKDLNQQFEAKHQRETGQKWIIQQSHGGSSRQARAVVDGLKPDVVALALSPDVDSLRKRGLIAEGWSKRLPHDSQPFTSTIVFVVRRGDPKTIRDWADLTGRDVSVITPSPKTFGNGKLSVMAAFGSVIYRGGTERQAHECLTSLYQRVPVLDAGSRSAAATFADEEMGDVHLTWENEALARNGGFGRRVADRLSAGEYFGRAVRSSIPRPGLTSLKVCSCSASWWAASRS